jgi:hypothetical protein
VRRASVKDFTARIIFPLHSEQLAKLLFCSWSVVAWRNVSGCVSDTFVDEALLAFGLSDRPGLEDLAKQLKATSCGRDDIPMDILMTFARFGKAELLAHLSAHAASETVHFIPGIGQITSMATAYVMQRKRLIAIIKETRAQAEKVHTDLFIPVAVHNTQ